MRQMEFNLYTDDGLRLRGRYWEPPSTPTGIVCIVHGLGDHGGRYAHVARRLNTAGYTVAAADLRGHGMSEGRRGHTPGLGASMNDISLIVREAGARFPGIPLFLYGHSMGGNLVLNFALRRAAPTVGSAGSPVLTGVVASAPLLETAFDPPCWKMLFGRTMRPFWPTKSMSNEVRVENLSRDPDVIRAYREDPLVHDRVTLTFLDIRGAGSWALKHAADLTVPTLVMHGDADRITSSAVSRAFAAAAGGACTLKLWEGFYHEIHNEPGKEQVFDYLVEWLNEKSAITHGS